MPRDNEFQLGVASAGDKERIKVVGKKGAPDAWERFDDEELGDQEMSEEFGYLPLGKKSGTSDGLGQKTMSSSRHPTSSASGSGSPLSYKLQDEEDFDDGGFFDEEQEFTDEELAEQQDQQFAMQQQIMFSVLSAIADRLGMSFSEGGDIYFSEDDHGYSFAEDDDEDDEDEDNYKPRAPAGDDDDKDRAMNHQQFSADPYLNTRLTALEMREKARNRNDAVNHLVDQYAAGLSEYNLDTEDIQRMREIAFSSDNPESALHQFSAVVAKNVPVDPPNTFTDYLSHESYAQRVPDELSQFADYGPDMYQTAETLWQPYQQYKTSTNSQINFKDYVKAQGQLGSTTNTAEGV